MNQSMSSSSSNSAPKFISFENSNTLDNSNLYEDDELANSTNSQNLNFSLPAAKDGDDDDDNYGNNHYYYYYYEDATKKSDHRAPNISDQKRRVCATTGRNMSQARDHVMAERKRRENLGQLFISLSKVVPGLKKQYLQGSFNECMEEKTKFATFQYLQGSFNECMEEKTKFATFVDNGVFNHGCFNNGGWTFKEGGWIYNNSDSLDKASLLEDAINHLKALQERVRVLEEEMMSKKILKSDHDSSVVGRSSSEIKARISDRHVLIKNHCFKKQKGLMMSSIIPCRMEMMHLSVLDMRIMPFGEEALHITLLAQMQNEFRGTAKDIVDQLHTVFFNPRRDRVGPPNCTAN
ncbi:hypothetical protein OROHE_026682 [Orobanche hederae]